MDLVSLVVCCNCAIAAVIVLVTVWIVGWRKQVVAWGKWFDRWESECRIGLSDAPRAIAASRAQMQYLRQIYRQQLRNIDRLQSLRSALGIFRSLLASRRRSR